MAPSKLAKKKMYIQYYNKSQDFSLETLKVTFGKI